MMKFELNAFNRDITDDELLEVTPVDFRIRKRILSAHERGRQNKNAKKAMLQAA